MRGATKDWINFFTGCLSGKNNQRNIGVARPAFRIMPENLLALVFIESRFLFAVRHIDIGDDLRHAAR